MEHMKGKVLLLMAIGLAGCLPNQREDMEACRSEAERFYHMYKAVDPDDPSSQYIKGCMTAKGYHFTITPADCDTRYPLATQSTCYEPNSWLNSISALLRRARETH
jgi:hypothetical protein